MKKFLSSLILSIFILALGPWTVDLSGKAAFSDVPSSHPNHQAILYVQSQGIVDGYNDGTFKPDQPINRAEFTKILIEAIFADQDINDCVLTMSYLFNDVERSVWFGKYVCLAKKLSIIQGYPDGSFQPTNNINFAEAAKIIVNTLGIETISGDPWFQPFIDALTLRKAVPSSIKSAQQTITRGEMTEIIYRLRDLIEQNISSVDSDTPADDPTTTLITSFKQEIISLVNVERSNQSLGSLTHNTYLESSAQYHSDDMQAKDYFEHDSLDGTTPNERIAASGYLNEYNACNCNKSYITAENIAIGQTTPAEVIETWMNSPEHRANILNPEFTEIGIGITKITTTSMGNYKGYFWVQNFGNVSLEQ